VCCRDIFEDVTKMKIPFIYNKGGEEGGRVKKENNK